MPESANIEIAKSLSEDKPSQRKLEVIEILEVLVLAIVAIATAWSGYQASKWDARQSLDYGTASRDRFEADAAANAGGQQLSADSAMFTAWLQANEAGNLPLQHILVRRFSVDYRVAFTAWLATDPLTTTSTPAGPAYMPEYHNPSLEQAKQLNEQASAIFESGTAAAETADRFVRNTVLLASVLFLSAIAQRLKVRSIRLVASCIGWVLLAYAVVSIAWLPHL